jgi:hypothetical protein
LKLGRVAAVHVKDRILFGNATGTGMSTVDPFSDMTSAHYMRARLSVHGPHCDFDGRGAGEQSDIPARLDGTVQGRHENGRRLPEYILLFRKLPSDTSRAYADTPVIKEKKRLHQSAVAD